MICCRNDKKDHQYFLGLRNQAKNSWETRSLPSLLIGQCYCLTGSPEKLILIARISRPTDKTFTASNSMIIIKLLLFSATYFLSHSKHTYNSKTTNWRNVIPLKWNEIFGKACFRLLFFYRPQWFFQCISLSIVNTINLLEALPKLQES